MARMAAQGGNGLVGASRNLPTGMRKYIFIKLLAETDCSESESSRRALADAIRRCINEDEDSTKKYGLDYNRAGPAERAHYPWTEGTGTLFKPLKFEQFMSSNEIDTIELLGPADSNNFSPQEGENVTFVKQYFQLLFFHDPNMGMNTMNRYLPAKLRGGSHDSGFKQVQDKVFKAKGEVLSKCKRFGRMLAL